MLERRRSSQWSNRRRRPRLGRARIDDRAASALRRRRARTRAVEPCDRLVLHAPRRRERGIAGDDAAAARARRNAAARRVRAARPHAAEPDRRDDGADRACRAGPCDRAWTRRGRRNARARPETVGAGVRRSPRRARARVVRASHGGLLRVSDRAAFREQIEALAAQAERSPGRYRLHVLGLVLQGYATLLGLSVGSALLGLAVIVLAGFARVAVIGLKLGLPLLGFSILVARSTWVRLPAPGGWPIERRG